MKGGITSGIVYPAAILRLKDKYRFRNIGGTSAGAMAAALTAAAEYGRQSLKQSSPWLEGGNESRGFAGLKKTRDELCQPGLLLGLFQPSRPTRSLFRFLLYLRTGPVPPRSVPLGWLYPPALGALEMRSPGLRRRGDLEYRRGLGGPAPLSQAAWDVMTRSPSGRRSAA